MSKFPKKKYVPLSDLKRSSRDVDDASDLDPDDLPEDLIIEFVEGKTQIIDGMHRAAGMLGWCESEGIDPKTILIPVVDVTEYDDTDTVEKAADGFSRENQNAVRKIHRLAK